MRNFRIRDHPLNVTNEGMIARMQSNTNAGTWKKHQLLKPTEGGIQM